MCEPTAKTPTLPSLWQAVDEAAAVDELRELLVKTQSIQERARERLDALQQREERLAQSSRKGFLRSLEEQIGLPPQVSWRVELIERASVLVEWSNPLSDEWTVENAQSLLTDNADGTWEGGQDSVWLGGADPRGGLLAAFSSPENQSVKAMRAMKWPSEDALIYCALSWPRPRIAIARGLSTSDPSFAACTYALSDVMFRQAKAQVEAGLAPPPLFRHLLGKFSLAEADGAWASIEEADAAGFRGLTSSVLVRARRAVAPDEDCLREGGFAQFCHSSRQLELQQSPVVCFISSGASDQGMHSAIITEGCDGEPTHGAFPPNTLYRLVEVKPAGWTAPNGVVVNQSLLIVRATYRQPSTSLAEGGAGKLVGSSVTLQYGSRAAYIKGLSDVVDRPVLSMVREFTREMSWTDWKGVSYTLRGEWEYVTGPAVCRDDCTPGRRDALNDGKLPATFVEEVNAFIRQRREESSEIRQRLADQFAYLSLDEVLAVRLYSGPAYQVINGFLRQVAHLSGSHRRALVGDLGLTFAATIGHIVSAIRKLAAAATREESTRKLYRGVRGEPPRFMSTDSLHVTCIPLSVPGELARGFWLKDSMGMVGATDTAFMSTSRSRATPIDYMGDGENVLWELEPREESDTAFHCGADISLLSQFAAEEEVLFPPCCLLVVKAPPEQPPPAVTEKGRRFVAVAVQPSFV